ncbi:MAG TPA: glycosyltransferase [Anaerolineales bacterium]|jgi:sterol 3beta-glucosyltransferase|nr:glycosyltransferase [Anaerolineales bacterium]HQX15740.1 glycosyltransferase [Anaerolineales bacterium]
MQITILTAGSQGDIQPYLALAVGLKNEGYEVRFVANSNFAKFVARYGIDFFPIKVDSFKFAQTPEAQAWLESVSIPKLIVNTTRAVRSVAHQIATDVLDACREADIIIYHSFTLPFVYFIGKQFNIPCIPASIDPLPNGSHPAISLNIHWNRSRGFNLLSHWIVDEFAWRLYSPIVRKAWKGKVNIPAINPNQQMLKDNRLILSGYSPSVLPRPVDLPQQIVITGYWFLGPDTGWQADPALIDFIHQGRRPLYVGFGSMGNAKKNEFTALAVLQALADTGQRAVLGAGWSELGADKKLPGSVFMLKSVPHSWLFPQMSVIVHHAGPGTTAAALSAGIPNVVVPHFASQFFYAQHLAKIGVAAHPIPRKNLSTERLNEAIELALRDRTIFDKANEMSEKIRFEDGIQTAIRALHPYIG